MPGEQTLLRALVTGRHWQRFETFDAQFVRAAKELAVQAGEPSLAKVTVSRRQFERWYAGRVKTAPHPDACRVLEHMFGCPVQQLLAPQQDEDPGSAQGGPVPAGMGWPDGAGTWAGMVPWRAEELPDGWELAPERMLSMAARRAVRFSAAADASNVGPQSLDALRAEAGRLAVAYPQEPVAGLVADIVSLQDLTFTLLEGRQRPRETRDLYVLAALFSGMLAKAAHDVREPYTAMAHARTAALCADNAEHSAVAAWVGGLQSLIAYWAGRPREALEYAQAASGSDPGRGTVAVWLAALEARAYARLGSQHGSLAAIERAERLREQVSGDDLDELGGMCRFSVARQLYYAADACASLPSPAASDRVLAGRAEGYAAQAITAYEDAPAEERSFGDEAGSRTDLAIARIRAGGVEGAWEAIAPVLDLPVAQRINGITRSLADVHRAVTERGVDSPAGREVQEAIEACCRTPVPALPR